VQRVVILGGGFGGLYAAKALKNAPVQITLIDKRNFHLFQPLGKLRRRYAPCSAGNGMSRYCSTRLSIWMRKTGASCSRAGPPLLTTP